MTRTTVRISSIRVTAQTAMHPVADALAAEYVVERIDVIFEKALDDGPIASCDVAAVKDGRLVLARGFGYADLENRLPATAETVYRLCSITKQFTAAPMQALQVRPSSPRPVVRGAPRPLAALVSAQRLASDGLPNRHVRAAVTHPIQFGVDAGRDPLLFTKYVMRSLCSRFDSHCRS